MNFLLVSENPLLKSTIESMNIDNINFYDAINPIHALRKMNYQNFDILFIDYDNLKQMSGDKFLEALNDEYPKTKKIIYSSQDNLTKNFKKNSLFIQKPKPLDELLALVTNELNQQLFNTQNIKIVKTIKKIFDILDFNNSLHIVKNIDTTLNNKRDLSFKINDRFITFSIEFDNNSLNSLLTVGKTIANILKKEFKTISHDPPENLNFLKSVFLQNGDEVLKIDIFI